VIVSIGQTWIGQKNAPLLPATMPPFFAERPPSVEHAFCSVGNSALPVEDQTEKSNFIAALLFVLSIMLSKHRRNKVDSKWIEYLKK
jgi:hypothetical protein